MTHREGGTALGRPAAPARPARQRRRPVVTGQWRGRGAGMARAWHGHGAGVARACPVIPAVRRAGAMKRERVPVPRRTDDRVARPRRGAPGELRLPGRGQRTHLVALNQGETAEDASGTRRNGCGRVPDASHAIGFQGTGMSRTRPGRVLSRISHRSQPGRARRAPAACAACGGCSRSSPPTAR
eukprot:gene16709-biopygen23295